MKYFGMNFKHYSGLDPNKDKAQLKANYDNGVWT